MFHNVKKTRRENLKIETILIGMNSNTEKRAGVDINTRL